MTAIVLAPIGKSIIMAYSRDYVDLRSFTTTFVKNGVLQYANPNVVNFSGTRSGEKVPDWKTKVANGQSASSPFTSDRSQLVRGTPGEFVLRVSLPPTPSVVWQTHVWDGYTHPPARPTKLSTSEAKANNDALTSVYRKIAQEQTHMAGASALAEFGDVLRQFGRPYRSIVDLIHRHLDRVSLETRRLRGSKTRKAEKLTEIVASTWLETSFGLIPLISDTRDLAEAVARWQYEYSETGVTHARTRVVGRGVDTTSSTVTTNTVPTSTWAAGINHTRRTTETRVQYIAGLSASVLADYGSNERLIQLLGFQPQDFVPAVWEVVPWSWLVDYFTNVGNIISAAATVTAGVTWVNKTVSHRTIHSSVTKLDQKLTADRVAAFGGVIHSLTGESMGAFESIRTEMVRTVPPSLGIPSLQFTLPGEMKQLANMAAVLIARKPSTPR